MPSSCSLRKIWKQSHRVGPARFSICPAARRICCAILAVSATAHSAFAVSQVSVQATTNSAFNPVQNAPSGTLSQSARTTDPGGAGTAEGSAQASFGVLRVYSEGRAVSRPDGVVSGGGSAAFEDDILIDAPGLTGATGSVKVKFIVGGNISCSTNGVDPGFRGASQTRATIVIFVDGAEVRRASQFANYLGAQTGIVFLNAQQEQIIPFTYGTPFALKFSISTSATAYCYHGAVSIGDLSHTATWGGFAEVKDSQGAIVTSYTASSTSGTNYTQPILPAQPVVGSRHVHAGVGAIDINLPLTGTAAVESRSGGPGGNHQIVLTFANPITFIGASVTSGIGSVATSSGSGTNVITLDLAGVDNAQRIAVTLTGVNTGIPASDIVIPMGILLGDSNGDGGVNSADATQTRTRSGSAADATTFRSDYNLDGTVNGGDVFIARARSGTSLPPAALADR